MFKRRIKNKLKVGKVAKSIIKIREGGKGNMHILTERMNFTYITTFTENLITQKIKN